MSRTPIQVDWVAPFTCLRLLCAYYRVHVLADDFQERVRRVRRLFWCGCCFCPCGGCGRWFKFQTLPLWFLLGRALPHSPPEEDTVVLRARNTGLGLDADNRRASVTWCTRSKVHRCCELPMQKLFSLYQNAAGSDYEERLQPMQLRYIAKCTQEVKQPLETSQFRIEPTSLDCYLC